MSATLQAEASPSHTSVVKRTLCVHIAGSLANLALAGPQAAMWKPVSGKETAIFCPTLEADMDPAEQVNSIRNGLIRSLTLKEAHSTFPCALGVSVSCIPATEVTDLGERYAYTVLPTSTISSPQVVYACDASIQQNTEWRQRYGSWNRTNLETEGVIPVPNQPFVFVHMNHPAVGVLRFNSELIGCDIDKQPRIDQQYYKVTRQVLNECCKTLRAKVLSNLHTQDMNMFSIQLHRLNAETWDEIGDGTVALQGFKVKAKWSPEEEAREKEHHLKQFLTNNYQYIARLEVEYEVPNAAVAA